MGAVALRKESVDRNIICLSFFAKSIVALRKESVDRNCADLRLVAPLHAVALRKESVDRNHLKTDIAFCNRCRSPQGERG